MQMVNSSTALQSDNIQRSNEASCLGASATTAGVVSCNNVDRIRKTRAKLTILGEEPVEDSKLPYYTMTTVCKTMVVHVVAYRL